MQLLSRFRFCSGCESCKEKQIIVIQSRSFRKWELFKGADDSDAAASRANGPVSNTSTFLNRGSTIILKESRIWRLNPSSVSRAVSEWQKSESFSSQFSSSLLSLALCHWWWCHSGRDVCRPTHCVYVCVSHAQLHTLSHLGKIFFPFPFFTSCDYFPHLNHAGRRNDNSDGQEAPVHLGRFYKTRLKDQQHQYLRNL